jgi:energy-coupling factor transporter ATP-binding protein EcfA2
VQRLRGVRIEASGPLREGFIEFGDATVLVGPNDSGKTRVLKLLESALRNPLRPADGQLELFALASAPEMRAFLDRSEPEPGLPIIREEWQRPLASFRAELALLPSDGDVPLGVDVPTDGPLLPTWSYGRAPVELAEELRREITRAAPHAVSEPDVPVKLEFLGGMDPQILPEAITVPSPAVQVEEAAGKVVAELCRSLRSLSDYRELLGGEIDAPEIATALDWEPPPEIGDVEDLSRQLLDERPSTTAHHPAATLACQALQRLAGGLLPDFIGRVYRPIIVPGPPGEVTRGRLLDIRLEKVRTDAESESTSSFPLGDAAAGLNVWLQLALREATARLQVLNQLLADCFGRAQELESWLGEDEENVPETTGLFKQAVESVFASLGDPVGLPPESLAETSNLRAPRRQGNGEPTDRDLVAEWRSGVRTRLYLLDEPEQHLHPSLQRRSAGWLAELMDTWGCQCVLATHSFAFIDLPGDVCVYELVREGGEAVVRRFDIEGFRPDDQLARAMGFDRGELLSRWRAFLFVEGRADLAVIEELFEDRLLESGVCVLPVHGHRNHAGLLDMAVLALGTAAPIAALFDGITDAEIQSLRRLDAEGRHRERTRRDELGTVVRIIDLELEHDRSIDILTVGAPDIFDLLDEDAIRRVSSTSARLKAFPGHEQARAQFERCGGGNAGTYKAFLQREYGVKTSEKTIRRITRRMKDMGHVPVQLDELLMRLERLALAAESDEPGRDGQIDLDVWIDSTSDCYAIHRAPVSPVES